MKISMICAVYGSGKSEILLKLAQSILDNDYRDVEFILVDQNSSDEYKDLLNIFFNNTFVSFKYLKSKIGLSIARNEGLKVATGDIICFPDDDCEYPADFFSKIICFFCNNLEYSILITKVRDLNNEYDLRFTNKKNSGQLDMENVFTNCCSISIFHKRVNSSECFDEKFGLGAVYCSCEDYDYVLARMNKGEKVYFRSDLYVLHPDSNTLSQKSILKKIKSNAIGHGALFRKYSLSIWKTCSYNFIAPLIGLLFWTLSLDEFKIKMYYYLLKYRLIGFFKYTVND